MSVQKLDGWIVVSPYAGKDTDKAFIAVQDKDSWIPAYIDVINDERCAKVRVPLMYFGQTVPVWLRIGTEVMRVGRVAA